MFDLFRLWLGALLRLFRTRRSLLLENLALRQQLAVFKRQQPRPRLGAIDKLFWVVARRFWAHWKRHSLSSYRTPLRAGIDPGSNCTGPCSAKCENQWAVAAGSPSRSVNGSFKWSLTIPVGVRLASMENSGCSASTCRKPPFPAGSNERPRTLNPPSAGWPFCAIIGKLSRPWISSPSRMVKKLILAARKGSLPDRSLMPLPAHSTSADHLVVPCNAQFCYPRSPLDSARGTGAGSACPGDCAPRGNGPSIAAGLGAALSPRTR